MPTAASYRTPYQFPAKACPVTGSSVIDDWVPESGNLRSVLLRGYTLTDVMAILWKPASIAIAGDITLSFGTPSTELYTARDPEFSATLTGDAIVDFTPVTAVEPKERVCGFVDENYSDVDMWDATFGRAWHFSQLAVAYDSDGRKFELGLELNKILRQDDEYALVFDFLIKLTGALDQFGDPGLRLIGVLAGQTLGVGDEDATGELVATGTGTLFGVEITLYLYPGADINTSERPLNAASIDSFTITVATEYDFA